MFFDGKLLIAVSTLTVHLVLWWPWPLTVWPQDIFSSVQFTPHRRF